MVDDSAQKALPITPKGTRKNGRRGDAAFGVGFQKEACFLDIVRL